MKINKPDINPSFFYGPIISYQFRGDIAKDRDKYRIRFTLTFKSGDSCTLQKGGFKSKAEARRGKEVLISQLEKKEYIPFDYTVKEFFDYWLYYYCIQKKHIAYGTFQTYRNCLYNHLLPALGAERKLKDVTSTSIENAVSAIPYPSVMQMTVNVVRQVFQFACSSHYLLYNPSVVALRNLSESIPKTTKRSVEPYTVQEIRNLLYNCKEYYWGMYIALLLAITTGLRISETIGLKYADVDFTSCTIFVRRQLGRDINDESDVELTTKEIETKTHNSVRSVPVPRWIIDEIIVRRAWYENQKATVADFKDMDYICCKENGTPYNRSSFGDAFHELTEKCGLRYIYWHDLRHIYSSVLKDNEINMKAISEYLGHYSPEFTEETYVYQKEPVYDCTILSEVWEDLCPEKIDNDCLEVLVIPFTNNDYLSMFL